MFSLVIPLNCPLNKKGGNPFQRWGWQFATPNRPDPTATRTEQPKVLHARNLKIGATPNFFYGRAMHPATKPEPPFQFCYAGGQNARMVVLMRIVVKSSRCLIVRPVLVLAFGVSIAVRGVVTNDTKGRSGFSFFLGGHRGCLSFFSDTGFLGERLIENFYEERDME